MERVSVVWDFSSIDQRFGSFFIFLQELVWCSAKKKIIYLRNYNDDYRAYLNVLEQFKTLDMSVEINVEPESVDWPPPDVPLSDSAARGSFILFRQLLNRKAPMSIHLNNRRLARGSSTNGKIIAVHLKNSSVDIMSNANLSAWYSFFVYCSVHYSSFDFLLVGDDEVSANICSLPNVRRVKTSVADYFSFVCEADGFLGMASAFSAAAIMGNKPYRIWKHEGHHTKEMERELDEENQFPFHISNQKMIIGEDNYRNIKDEFLSLISVSGFGV